MIKRLLIANRGEIACRIMHSAAKRGITTIAVYTDVDQHARHVRLSDVAVRIDDYLNVEAILAAAKAQHADALHPGYGFLSENPELARACAKHNVTFVGPPIEAMVQMADKSVAKQLMQAAKVPVVPGFYSDDANVDWQAQANNIGYPLLIKAVAGGGGRGMRLVEHPDHFNDALSAARREAKSYFADDRVFLEKYLQQPRHIELQIFADRFGEALYLGERDCSIQRRHQKIIEEAPAPNFDSQLRQRMGETAVRAAQAIGYVGAGTVEFLLDQDQQFYFMEMNTRLQVEHPVTECVTGFDLVDWQLNVAEGQPLPCQQDEVRLSGHAIEVRLYAEDPDHDFMPSSGELVHCQWPVHENIRVDFGYEAGDVISMHYDPMLAKLIVHAQNRPLACELMIAALSHTEIVGIRTNTDFLSRIIRSQPFQQAQLSTHFLGDYASIVAASNLAPSPQLILQAALALMDYEDQCCAEALSSSSDRFSPWAMHDGWQMNMPTQRTLELWWQDAHYRVSMLGQHCHYEGEQLSLEHQHRPSAVIWQHELHLFDDQHWVFHIGQYAAHDARTAQGSSEITAPMPGTVVDVFVTEGDHVKSGDRLLIIEAMKMEHTLTAHDGGVIKVLNVAKGDTVREGMALLQVE